MNVITVSPKNWIQARDVLYSAFINDTILLWLFDGVKNYQQHAAWAMQTWVKWCRLYGTCLATPNFESVVLWKNPGVHHFSLWGLCRSGMIRAPLRLPRIVFKRMLFFDHLIKDEQIKWFGSNNFWYCWLLATDQNHRQQGYGKALMNHIHHTAHTIHLPCWLETANKVNVIIYQKLGYRVLKTLKLPDAEFDIYCMIKEA